jgi:hypothetical protein
MRGTCESDRLSSSSADVLCWGRSYCQCLRGMVLLRMAVAALLFAGLIAGCGEEVDPVVQIRALVPEIAATLNDRDIAGLRRLGTGNFAANRLIIDVFPDGGTDTITLRFKRVRMLGDGAELFVRVNPAGETADSGRELVFDLVGNGRWRIDSFRLIAQPTPPDSVQGDTSAA